MTDLAWTDLGIMFLGALIFIGFLALFEALKSRSARRRPTRPCICALCRSPHVPGRS